MTPHEQLDRAHEFWEKSGLLAQSAEFTAWIEQRQLPMIVMQVEIGGVGRNDSMRIRCVKSVPVERANEELQIVVHLLYTEMQTAIAKSRGMGVKF